MGTISEAYPHLIFDKFSSKLGVRAANILKYLFPAPKHDTKRVITFANQVGSFALSAWIRRLQQSCVGKQRSLRARTVLMLLVNTADSCTL